jgi:hypothetical protein
MAYCDQVVVTERKAGSVKTEIVESLEMNTTPDRVWAIMGGFGSIADWHPAIASSPVKDGVRILMLEGGGEVHEPLVEHSDAERYYVYAISSGPFPITGYLSRLSVEQAGSGARMTWTGEFETETSEDAATYEQVFRNVYTSGMDGIREQAEKG